MTYWKAFWLNVVVSWVLIILAILTGIGFGPVIGFLSVLAAIILRGEILWRIGCAVCGKSFWGGSGRWAVYFQYFAPDKVCSGCGRRN